MKVIQITKSFRNGTHIGYIITKSEDPLEEVEAWAERDPGGQNYGYDISYNEVVDKDIIKSVILKEITDLDNKINNLLSEKEELKKFYKTL